MQALNRPMDSIEKAEFELASQVVRMLEAAYPNFGWSVCVDVKQGIMKIIEPAFMDQTVPYVVLLHEIIGYEKIFRKKIVEAGGEILERYCLSREAMSSDKVQDRIHCLPRDSRGHAILDRHCVKNWIGKAPA